MMSFELVLVGLFVIYMLLACGYWLGRMSERCEANRIRLARAARDKTERVKTIFVKDDER